MERLPEDGFHVLPQQDEDLLAELMQLSLELADEYDESTRLSALIVQKMKDCFKVEMGNTLAESPYFQNLDEPGTSKGGHVAINEGSKTSIEGSGTSNGSGTDNVFEASNRSETGNNGPETRNEMFIMNKVGPQSNKEPQLNNKGTGSDKMW